MATMQENEVELRAELDELRSQIAGLLNSLKDKGEDKASKISDQLQSELDYYQKKATEKLNAAYEKGHEGVDAVNQQVSSNPMISLLIAFTAGFAISKLLELGK
jgi:ElaB/YqjD/DUF883 family membrane-anchored ribosome-binding protein